MDQGVFFGVAGNPPNFWASSFRTDRANAPKWLREIGLDALEIQCTYGVRMPKERAEAFRENAEQCAISLSLHAPYYISLGSSDTKKIDNTLRELRKAVQLAKTIGSKRVVFHPGWIEGDRKAALSRAIETLRRFEEENDLGEVCLFPETAGKRAQLGSLKEILTICEAVEHAWPCLDLAHVHAFEHGSLRRKENFARILKEVEGALGEGARNYLHIHFYPIEWGPLGEITHRAFHDVIPRAQQLNLLNKEVNSDTCYLPRYEPLLELLVQLELAPTIICEAKDSQDSGALEMKAFYTSLVDDSSNTIFSHQPSQLQEVVNP